MSQVVRCRYTENVENGKIGASVFAEKALFFSVDLAAEDPSQPVNDWQTLQNIMQPNQYVNNMCFIYINRIDILVLRIIYLIIIMYV